MKKALTIAGVLLGCAFCVLMGYVSALYGDWIGDKPIRIVLLPAMLVLMFLFFAEKSKLFLLLILTRVAIDPVIDATRVGPLSLGAAMNGLVLLIAFLYFLEKPRPVARIVIPMWLPLLGIMAYATLHAPDLGLGVRTMLGYCTSMAVFTVAFYLPQCQKNMKFAIWLVLFSSLIPALYGPIDYAQGGWSPGGGEIAGRVRSTFPHPNIFAFYLVVVISLAFYLIKSKLMKTTAAQRWLLTAYIVLLVTDLVLTKTRSAWVACVVVFVVYGVLFERRYLVYMAGGAVAALSIPAIQDRLLDLNTATVYWTNGIPQNSFEWRKMIWEAAWNWSRPSALPLGYGLGAFQFHSLEFFRLSAGGGSGAHNVYVQWLFEAGVVGIACAAWLFARLLNLLRQGMQHDRLGTVIVMTVVVEYLVVAYSDNMLDYLAFNWYFWFIIGTACSIIVARRAAEAEPEPEIDAMPIVRQPLPLGAPMPPPRVHGGAGMAGGSARLGAVVAMVVVAAMAVHAPRAQAQQRSALPTDSIFAPTSFWYSPIPADAPLHPNSAGFVADFLRQKKAFYGNVTINLESWASPVYVAAADTPTVRVEQWACMRQFGLDPALVPQWSDVPIPAHAATARGSDAEMTIYQPSTDTIWEFWQMRKTNGQWQACWGGRMQNASKSDGAWPGHYGTTATGLPFLGGQITAEELQRGEIRHAIGIALVETESSNVVSWPAKRSDGWNPKNAPNRIPEGLRFRLDPAVDVEALKMHGLGKVIARAAQKYGFIVWDKAGAISLRAQNPKSYTAAGQPDPYPALFRGAAPYAILEGFPWDRLQFMPKDYGKPAR